ncbi:MAG: GTP 3',8-cyclase MoaA [Fusobacterium sp.]|nr:GTP 3',8-cyclase MoaA [Fusobacterium sp.]
MLDLYNRKVEYVRLSVTDRCNLRCIYCMPENNCFFDEEKLLSFDEYKRLLEFFKKLGINKVKLTGGEPLIREGIIDFIESLKKDSKFKSVTITTNGLNLDRHWKRLKDIGIDGINISLDSLDEANYKKITRGGNLKKVLQNIDMILKDNYQNLKINIIPIRNINEHEILDFVELAKNLKIAVRFIELMPIGEASKLGGITREEIVKKLTDKYGEPIKTINKGNGPADYITFNDFKGNIGFIDAVNHKFCSTCNRIRIDSLGNILLCLHHHNKISSKDFLDGKINEDEFLGLMTNKIYYKPKENTFLNKTQTDTNMNRIGG